MAREAVFSIVQSYLTIMAVDKGCSHFYYNLHGGYFIVALKLNA
ncbi:hypothetical protein CPter91_1809 [Collimonas pratensis]|uniref:Uncharacterized protein n=1 Tax=Collimonas pratensis TaxID=279113 RepID=A0A127Q3G5_9BURK|nr:hypothetical protein CPter91_1809 [Collimonas pratensis]